MAFTMRTPPTGGDWNERPATATSNWVQRTSPFGLWIDDYYPWLETSHPWLIELGSDWTPRTEIT